jgi:DnaJ family protein C protein 9
MDTEDPIHQFFTPADLESPYALYKTLNLPTPTSSSTRDETLSAITSAEIRTAYRKAALKYHPDKHASKEEGERKRMEREFQRVGFAFAVLSDETRRRR